eukprot:TRINITY_DN6583_c0_g2_i1.p1 TRINITY_DN6583_c0_g2~~TRINITY_DN6583_c0_g2_i1.p1  ORF type:complete len:427 (+),score=165.17 TRINITY_DN6583_c0_g2_i1:223-1503(+)
MDVDKDGVVSRVEFLAFTKMRRGRLRLAFDRLCSLHDPSQRTSFTAANLREAAAESHVSLSDDDLRRIVAKMDRDQSGNVDFPEFVEALMLAPAINPKAFLDKWFVDSFSDDSMSEYTTPREMRPSPADFTTAADGAVKKPSFAAMLGKKVFCGGVAGIASRTLTAPIDRVRLMMITSKEPLPIATAFKTAIDHPRRYLALWTGNGVNCLKIAPEMGIKLVAFDVFKNKFAKDPDNVTTLERFAAGGAAGALGQTMVYPMEVVRTRLSCAPRGTYAGAVDCAKAVWREGGAAAFAAGLAPSIVGIIPYAALDLSLNSIFKERAAAYLAEHDREVSVPVLLGCGMASSTVATLATFPLGVIRTKAQATGGGVKAVLESMKGQGLRGWYRGVVPCLSKVLPSTSISYTVYEKLVDYYGKVKQCPVHHG